MKSLTNEKEVAYKAALQTSLPSTRGTYRRMRRVQRYINKIKWIDIPEIEIQIVILDITAGGRERVGIQAQMKSTSATDTNLVRL